MRRVAWMATIVCVAAPSLAAAQGVELVGTRALGMGGAFVAVADDASAVYWNPAGLPRSNLVTATVEHLDFDTEEQDVGSASLVAIGTPPLAVSYYRLRTPALSAGGASSLVTHHVGGTLVQSIGEYLDVATTVRFVRGVAGSRASQTVDLDLGALVVVRNVRAGLLVRNLREPEFETVEEGVALSLDRQVRAGVAWQSTSEATTVACDVDLTTSHSPFGPQRHVSLGGEQWFPWFGPRRLAARAGLRLKTVDDVAPIGSAGVSVRLTASLYADGQITRGGEARDRSWGIALRFAY